MDPSLWALWVDEDKHSNPQPDIMHRKKDLAIVRGKWYVSIKSLSQLRNPRERVGIKRVKTEGIEDTRKKKYYSPNAHMNSQRLWQHSWPAQVCTCACPLHTYYGFQVCLLTKFLSVWMSKFQLFFFSFVSLCSVPSVAEDQKSYKNVIINTKTWKNKIKNINKWVNLKEVIEE